MRASLLAVVAIAMVAGLLVVVAVKSLGLLDRPKPPEPVVQAPPPPKPPAPPAPRVIIARRPLFVNDSITSPTDTLTIREVRPEELKDYEAHKDEYVPAMFESVYLRYLARDVEADRPLKKADFQDVKKPEALNARLFPGTRAVHVGVMKDRSAGGNIQVGDWVDVFLTTEVSRSDNPAPVPYTALLVPHVQVIAKRNSLYPIYAPLPEGKPVEFTVAANPYRAALLEHARHVGVLSMTPVPADEKKRLDNLRDEAIKNPAAATLAAAMAPPGSPEFKEEQGRLERHASGAMSIGDDDLVRLLRLPVIDPPLPPSKPPKPPKLAPPPPPVTVELFNGPTPNGLLSFPVPYTPPPQPEPPEPAWVPPPPVKYSFRTPAAVDADTKPAPAKPKP